MSINIALQTIGGKELKLQVTEDEVVGTLKQELVTHLQVPPQCQKLLLLRAYCATQEAGKQ